MHVLNFCTLDIFCALYIVLFVILNSGCFSFQWKIMLMLLFKSNKSIKSRVFNLTEVS